DALREVVEDVLAAAGYAVMSAAHPQDALELAQRHAGTIDILLTDVIMPDLNGIEVARRLKRTRPDVRTLFMSGYLFDAVDGQTLPESLDLIAKPFSAEDLAQKVRDVLDRPPSPLGKP